MSITMLVTHHVENFDTWKIGFDVHNSVRAEAGIKVTPYKEIGGDPNHVHIIGTVPSKKVSEEFFSCPEMQEVMKNAGVISKHEMTFLEEA